MKLYVLFYCVTVCSGQSYTRPQCDNVGSSTCLSFDPDPDPIPYPVIDKLGGIIPNPNLPPPPPPPPIPPGQDDPELDIVAKTVDIPPEEEGVFRVRPFKLERYFPNMDIGRVRDEFEGTDLEVIEWPGIISDKRDATGTQTSYQHQLQKRLSEKFIPMSFEGEISIFRSYICNRRLGTHIRALGFRPINRNDSRFLEYIPFYLAFGPRSFHRGYIQPQYVPVSQLNSLAEGHADPECQPIPIPPLDADITLDPNNKLNHILDFAFSTNRLIFGMYCGILVLKPIDAPTNYIEAARRIPDPDDYSEEDVIIETYSKFLKGAVAKKQKFIGRINRVSSNVCCFGVCNEMLPIAAAYSYSLQNTEQHLKRIYVSFDHGDSWDVKLMSRSDTTFLKLINGLYNRVNLVAPEFILRRVVKMKATDRWGNDTDHVVRAILEGVDAPENPTVQPNEVICAEIVSLQVLQEESRILALCRTDLGDPLARLHPQGIQLNINYAVFQFEISRFSPLIHGTMRSKRRLACTIKNTDLLPNRLQPREPDVVLGPRSMNLYIVGCETILYHSVNGGYTFWNAVFYVKSQSGLYERRFQQPGFDIPLIAFDPDGNSVTFTFGDFYAVGFLSYTEEFRLLVGLVAETEGTIEDGGICFNAQEPCPSCRNTALVPPDCLEVNPICLDGANATLCTPYYDTFILFSSNRKFIPYYANSGDIKFAVSVMHFLLNNANPHASQYEFRKAIRLIDIPFRLTDAIRPFFEENTAITVKSLGFKKCHVFAFNIDSVETSIDLDEIANFTVVVRDLVEAELGVISSLPQALQIEVVKNQSSLTEAANLERLYVWRVSVTPRQVFKKSIPLYEDNFFGSSYDVFTAQSANLVLTNPPAQRCHTQPSGSVLVNLGCSGKILVAHEDYNRPHCQKFFGQWDPRERAYQTYTFRLEEGEYDPEMLSYWRRQDPTLFRREGNDWLVEYDYKTFGCPIEPYRLENFEPDLRILNLRDSNNRTDTAVGTPLASQYILIEIFGRTGYTYLKTVKEAGCKRAPVNFRTLLRDWKNRRKVIFEAFKTYKSFHPEQVAHPQNIWQKPSHIPCEVVQIREAEDVEDLRIPEDDPYEVMQANSGNAIVWDRKTRKDIYFFIAIEIDPAIGTFCDYTAYFAVSLNADIRISPLHSILRFFLVFSFLSVMIFLGYFAYRGITRRAYTKSALYAKLERGAWEILLRYEKYLHEVEVHGNTTPSAKRVEIVLPAKTSSPKPPQLTNLPEKTTAPKNTTKN